jgi:hypothetical protein
MHTVLTEYDPSIGLNCFKIARFYITFLLQKVYLQYVFNYQTESCFVNTIIIYIADHVWLGAGVAQSV